MQEELLIDEDLDKVVVKYAQNAREAGLDGVVCPPLKPENSISLRQRL